MGDIRTFNLDKYISKFNISTFVETGTLYGDSIEHFKNSFNNLHSIEIEKDLYEKAKERFITDEKITIHHGDSLSVLKDLVPTLGRTLFWLDAHFPGADCHKKKYNDEKDKKLRIPLLYELEIIRDHNHNDMIIIDDLWLYENGPFECGNFDNHSIKCNMGVTRKELMGDINSDKIYNLFKKTHKITKNYKHQGYLFLIPKKEII